MLRFNPLGDLARGFGLRDACSDRLEFELQGIKVALRFASSGVKRLLRCPGGFQPSCCLILPLVIVIVVADREGRCANGAVVVPPAPWPYVGGRSALHTEDKTEGRDRGRGPPLLWTREVR